MLAHILVITLWLLQQAFHSSEQLIISYSQAHSVNKSWRSFHQPLMPLSASYINRLDTQVQLCPE